MSIKMTLPRSGIVLDLSNRGRECNVRVFGGDTVRRIVIGEFDDRATGHRIHIANPGDFAAWNGDADTIPGISFRAGDVTIL